MLAKRIRDSLVLAGMGLFALLAAGCNPITRLNVTVALDPAYKFDGQMQVDIVAISPNDHQRWRDYSMTKYWEPNDAQRKSVTVFTMTLDPVKNPSQTLSASDEHWVTWLKGANDQDPPKLYVLAQIRKAWNAEKDDKPGDQDPRRQILPLGKNRWDDNLGSPPNVKLTVKSTGISTDTQPKRDKPGT
jgi:hypothetical protein